jgi:hypothetical protein
MRVLDQNEISGLSEGLARSKPRMSISLGSKSPYNQRSGSVKNSTPKQLESDFAIDNIVSPTLHHFRDAVQHSLNALFKSKRRTSE